MRGQSCFLSDDEEAGKDREHDGGHRENVTAVPSVGLDMSLTRRCNTVPIIRDVHRVVPLPDATAVNTANRVRVFACCQSGR